MFKKGIIVTLMILVFLSFLIPVLAKSAEDWILEGIAFYEQELYFEASYCFRRALDVDPGNKEAREWNDKAVFEKEKAKEEQVALNKTKGRIVYSGIDVKLNSSFEIISQEYTGVYIMNLDGTDKIKLSDGTGIVYDRHASGEEIKAVKFSPDGKWVTFVKKGELYIISSDGGNEAKLVFPEEISSIDYLWSPDSRRILFVSDGVLYTADINTNKKEIASTGGFNQQVFKWSPDGQKLAFIRYDNSLCVINYDGTNLKEMENDPSIHNRHNNYTFSPDGNFIVFCKNKTLKIKSVTTGEIAGIWCPEGGEEEISDIAFMSVNSEKIIVQTDGRGRKIYVLNFPDGGVIDIAGQKIFEDNWPCVYGPPYFECSPVENKILVYSADGSLYSIFEKKKIFLAKEIGGCHFSPPCCFSPDGNKIVAKKPAVFNSDGTGKCIVNAGFDVSRGQGLEELEWSGDSSKAAFAELWSGCPQSGICTSEARSYPRRINRVYICNSDGTDFHEIPTGEQIMSYDIFW